MNDPADIPQLFAQALADHQAGRLAEALPLYQQILATQPQHAEAMHMLGVLWHQAGHSAQGAELIAHSVSIAATPASLSNLGEVLRGRWENSKMPPHAWVSAIELNPNTPDAYCNLGMVMLDLERFDDAEKHLNRACQLVPPRGFSG